MKMMRYVIMALIVAAIVVVLAFCGGHSGEEAEEATPAAPRTADVPKGFTLAGNWYDRIGEKARMTITEGEVDNAYDVEITWPDGDDGTVVWNFSGTFDPEIGFLYYQNCHKTKVAATGEETVGYDDGTGAIVYFDEALMWQDDDEDSGAECRFVRLTEEESDTQEPL